MVVVLAESVSNPTSVNGRELQKIMGAARLFGCRVYMIPSATDTFDDIFAYVPTFDEPTLGIWIGVIPTFERYKNIYDAALKKNIHLINTPLQHRTAMEFDRFYPYLQGLTPTSVILHDISDIATVTAVLQFPVFVKGAVKSNKEAGWSAVVAQNLEELGQLAEQVLARDHRSRGKIIVRELVDLNTVAIDPNGFPIGREYRAFVYKGVVLAYGFYWDEYDDSQPLNKSEKQAFLSCLSDAATRVDAPFLSIDIGQQKNGDWIIIEIGDGQFSGLSQVPVLELWSKIKDLKL